MTFSAESKIVLTLSTGVARHIAGLLSDNGFVDGPTNINKLLPLNTEENIVEMIKLLKEIRSTLFDKSKGAVGMTQGEIICLSKISELYGILRGMFIMPKIEVVDVEVLFPVDVGDGIRKIELD